jgi:hypothetical protein
VKGAEIAGCGLLKAHGQGTESLELVEEDLDQVALGVGLLVQPRLTVAGGVGTDDGLHTASSHRAPNRVGIVARVGDHRFAFRVLEELFGDRGLVLLPGRDLDVERTPVRIDDRVDFGRESTT